MIDSSLGNNRILFGTISQGGTYTFSAGTAVIIGAYSASHYGMWFVRSVNNAAIAFVSAGAITVDCDSGTYTINNGASGTYRYFIIANS